MIVVVVRRRTWGIFRNFIGSCLFLHIAEADVKNEDEGNEPRQGADNNPNSYKHPMASDFIGSCLFLHIAEADVKNEDEGNEPRQGADNNPNSYKHPMASAFHSLIRDKWVSQQQNWQCDKDEQCASKKNARRFGKWGQILEIVRVTVGMGFLLRRGLLWHFPHDVRAVQL